MLFGCAKLCYAYIVMSKETSITEEYIVLEKLGLRSKALVCLNKILNMIQKYEYSYHVKSFKNLCHSILNSEIELRYPIKSHGGLILLEELQKGDIESVELYIQGNFYSLAPSTQEQVNKLNVKIDSIISSTGAVSLSEALFLTFQDSVVTRNFFFKHLKNIIYYINGTMFMLPKSIAVNETICKELLHEINMIESYSTELELISNDNEMLRYWRVCYENFLAYLENKINYNDFEDYIKQNPNIAPYIQRVILDYQQSNRPGSIYAFPSIM